MLDRLNVRYGKTYKNGSYVGRQYVRAEHPYESVGPQWITGRIADYVALDMFSCKYTDLTESELAKINLARQGGDWFSSAQAEAGAIHGHEVKVSRSDWLAELRDPTKADAWKRYCTYWWLVAPREVVCDDLPDGWGLLVPHGKSLKIAVRAARLDPEPMPVRTVAALTRAVMQTETRLLGGGR